jgi:hypothetical protein
LRRSPSSLDEITTGPKFVSLTDFIEQFGSAYSDLVIVDRREVKHLDAENFGGDIAKSEVPLGELLKIAKNQVPHQKRH